MISFTLNQRGKNHSKSPKASEACERLVAQAQTHLDADEGDLRRLGTSLGRDASDSGGKHAGRLFVWEEYMFQCFLDQIMRIEL